jgi:hypothetical protein
MEKQDTAADVAKYFTAREVNVLLPELETVFQHIDHCRQRVEALSEKAPSKAATPEALDARLRLRTQIEFLLDAIQQNIDAITRLGGVIKDLDSGLVDFLGWINGADIWLCWKRGEKTVAYWHSLYEGFGERQALPGQPASPSCH